MAREWVALYEEIFSHYPTAFGDSGQDTTLAAACVKFANSLFNRIERDRRWSLSYLNTSNSPTTTSAGTNVYAIPSTITQISHLYWFESTGQPVDMGSYDVMELRRKFGEGSSSQPGRPRYFAVNGPNVEIFPTPDSAGPSSGNYDLIFEGYTTLTPITQTTGTTVAASTALTVPSTAFLTDRGVATSGSYVSLMNAGNLGPLSVADTLLTGWSAFPGATTVTLTSNVITAITNAKVFFNSLNWVIANHDHVVLFGVLREVAAYLKENFQVWNDRFEQAYDDMAQYDVQRRKTLEQQAVGLTGQRALELGPSRSIYGAFSWGW